MFMLVPQLAPLLLAGLPLATLKPARDPIPFPPSGAVGRVAVWTNHDAPYRRGETARVYLRVEEPSYVAVFRVDTDGRIRVLFPREPWADSHLRQQHALELTGRRGADVLRVDEDPGVGYLIAIAADRPLDLRAITRGDAWDYRLIGGGGIAGDPYVALTDLAARLAPGGGYGYDISPYYVERHYEYPRFVCYDCHASASYDEWNPYATSCTRYRVVIRDDARYYPYRYGGNSVVADRPVHPGPRFVFRDTRPPHSIANGDEPARRRLPTPGPARHGDRGRAAGDRVSPSAGTARSTGEPELRRRRP
jgi:hypothetical protein